MVLCQNTMKLLTCLIFLSPVISSFTSPSINHFLIFSSPPICNYMITYEAITFTLVSNILLAHIIRTKFIQHRFNKSCVSLSPSVLHIPLSELNGGVLEVLNVTRDDRFPSWSCDFVARDHIISLWSYLGLQWARWHWPDGYIHFHYAKYHTITKHRHPSSSKWTPKAGRDNVYSLTDRGGLFGLA